MTSPIRYTILPARPEAHLYRVTCTVAEPDSAGQRFALPAWVPGSYMIRDFARHVVSIRAASRNRAVAVEKLDKHTWRAGAVAGPLGVSCEVYAWDLSVRGAHLDTRHAFFNGACVFLRVLGQEAAPCELEIVRPRGARYRNWRVATAMPRKGAKPAGFVPYDLDRENYTTLLWAFEGITSYYDDLALVRCGLIEKKDYLELLGRSITMHLRTPGRARQSLAESSFDAWIKYYRQDENSPNAAVSYYVKGSLVALCLDLLVRDKTRGRKSLDDVMRALWRRHGITGVGLEEDAIERLAEAATGVRLERYFDDWLRSTRELPLKALLATQGVEMELRPAESAQDKGGKPARSKNTAGLALLGIRARAQGDDTAVTHVLEGGAAQESGIAAGDLIVAVDELRPGQTGLDAVLARRRAGERVRIHAFRRDELRSLEVRARRADADTCVLSESASARARLPERWLRPGARQTLSRRKIQG